MIEALFNDPLTWIGLGLIIVVTLAVTLDILVVPTMILTLVALSGWFIYLIYVYRQNPRIGIFLGVLSLLLGSLYLFIIIRLRLWKWLAQHKKVPLPLELQAENIQEKIAQLNEGEVIAHTDLRPVGKIRANGMTLDGLAEIGFIPKGSQLFITEYIEGQYKVKKK